MRRVFEPHATQQSWSASGTISQDMSSKPFTITRMAALVRCVATTTTATWYNDPYDRILSRLNLTGMGKSFFDLSNLRAYYHASRMWGFGPKRPVPIADSLTTVEMFFLYIFHFGLVPFRINPVTGALEDNPWDLSAGIPPSGQGNLQLGGSFAANSVMGGNVTITDADIDLYLWGVQPEDGDSPELWMPRAFPVWSMEDLSLAATSTAFQTPHEIPNGDFLHSICLMLTNGTNAPRDDSVLNSLSVYNQLESRSVLQYGLGLGNALDYQAAEMLSQFGSRHALGYCPTDNVTTAMDGIASGGTAGTITVNGPAKDSGIVNINLADFAVKSKLPQYGVDYRTASSGSIRIKHGISDATGVNGHLVYRRYQLNPAHPANAGI